MRRSTIALVIALAVSLLSNFWQAHQNSKLNTLIQQQIGWMIGANLELNWQREALAQPQIINIYADPQLFKNSNDDFYQYGLPGLVPAPSDDPGCPGEEDFGSPSPVF